MILDISDADNWTCSAIISAADDAPQEKDD